MPETKVKELAKNRAYLVYFGEVEILALKLEGFKATQIGGTLSPVAVAVEGKQLEASDWLTVVKDKNQITMPYDVWARQVALEISKATGSSVNTISVTSGSVTASGQVGISASGSAEVKNIKDLKKDW